jgi:two-component system, OmpR family, KDP operon response regulator KdpE
MARGPIVLVVDDDPAIRKYLRRNLLVEGYRVRDCAPGRGTLDQIAEQPPNLVILDIDPPEGGGPDIVRAIREVSLVPIVATSTRRDEQTMVEALKSGADDFVVKPFGIREVLARSESALRRAIRQKGTSAHFVSGDLKVDLLLRRVLVKDKEVHLAPKAYEVLRILVEAPGKVHKHADILSAVWGPTRADTISYLRLAIRHLRRAIEPDPAHPVHLLTETRVGYRLRAQNRHGQHASRSDDMHERRTRQPR